MAAWKTRTRSLMWAVGFLLAGLLLAAQTIRLRLAEKAVRDGVGGTAFSLRPQNGWGAALHAEALLDAGDVAGAQRISIQALDRTPYAAVAVRTLAQTLEWTIGPQAAEPAWQVAGALGWRDKPTQMWAVRRALSNAESDIFAMRSDALLRLGGDDQAMTTMVRRVLTVPEVRRALISRLALNPPWRLPFFDVDQPLRGSELQGTASALLGLAGTGSEPTRRELADTIAGLIAEGRYQDALQLDRTFIRRKPDAGSFIDDGGFELAEADYVRNATPFDWVISEPTAILDRSNGPGRMALTTDGSRGLAAVVRYVPLSPAAYYLRFRMRGDRDSPAYLGVTVACASTRAILGSSDPSRLQTSEWQSRMFSFEVPAGCPLLRITLNASKANQSVEAVIDDIMISRA